MNNAKTHILTRCDWNNITFSGIFHYLSHFYYVIIVKKCRETNLIIFISQNKMVITYKKRCL